MPDYIYLLENRLSPSQRAALTSIREAARDEGMTVFLTGGAVRDLTSGSPVRDLDVSVQGNALNLKKKLQETGAKLWGEHAPSQTLFFRFPGSVRLELSSTRREEYPKPGKPVYEWASIHEDLRRRDFTVNAMALSLNEGSYGLLMDPTNGVADIDARVLRLVNNYGFLEDPIRMLRATRFMARLGWQMDERTQARFENARAEGVSSAISAWHKGYELEEIGHEENPLAILRAMDEAGWIKELCPAWTPAKADEQGLEQMHEVQTRLEMQGIRPDTSAAAMELLTAKMQPKEIDSLRKSFVRPGFVDEWKRLDTEAEEFQKELSSKEANTPSGTWKLFMRSNPEAILWLGLTGKGTTVQNKFKNFFNVWPTAKQKVPTALMQTLRITPELDRYPELLEELFYQTIDNRLETEEQVRAFLEPYSPPAPPPPVTVRRTRASKKGTKQSAAVEAARVADAGEDLHEEEIDDEAIDEQRDELLGRNNLGHERIEEMVQAPGQEEERLEVARRDTPAVGRTSPPEDLEPAASKTEPAAEAAPSTPSAKKVVPERKAPAKDVASPVQAAARLAGVKPAMAVVTNGSRKPAKDAQMQAAPKAGKTAAKGGTPAKGGKVAIKAAIQPAKGKPAAKGSPAAGRGAPAKKIAAKKAPARKTGQVHGKAQGKVAPGKHGGKAAVAKKASGKPAKKGKPAARHR